MILSFQNILNHLFMFIPLQVLNPVGAELSLTSQAPRK